MKIVAIREATVPIGSAMRNSSIGFDTMTASALAVITDRGLVGYAFDSIGRYAKGGLLRERFIPRLLAARPETLLDEAGLIDPDAGARAVMQNEKEGGHGERPGAVGLIDAALWDLRAKAEGKPLWRCLADRFRRIDAKPFIEVYASCGHFRSNEGLNGLRDEVKRAIDAGYRTVKIKVGGRDVEEDLRRIDTTASAVGEPARVAIDLNGKLDSLIQPAWIERVSRISGSAPAWIEEPAPPLDYARCAAFAGASPLPIATGENLFSYDDALNLLRYGGLRASIDRIQIDPLLAYGLAEYRRIISAFEAAGWSRRSFWPHAGHLFAAHVVAGLELGAAEAAPDASLAYGGYWDGIGVEQGVLRIADLIGVGYEGKRNLYAVLRPLSES